MKGREHQARDVGTAGMARGVREAILTDATVADVVVQAQALGYIVFDVDLGGCYDKEGLLDRTARALSFPEWFGRNWDAWFDCLTDLSWQPRAPGYVLLLRRVARLRQTAPEALDTALAILEDASRVWADRGVTWGTLVDADHAA